MGLHIFCAAASVAGPGMGLGLVVKGSGLADGMAMPGVPTSRGSPRGVCFTKIGTSFVNNVNPMNAAITSNRLCGDCGKAN